VGAARATLDGDGGPIELQLNRRGKRPAMPDALVPRADTPGTSSAIAPFTRPELIFDNTFGGFDAETGEYVIVLEGEETTPAPWINALASPTFGCTVSEAGVGCTWALNSHENRITTWNNDPVSDGSGEAIYIRDEETGEFWSPTPLPVRTPEPYVIRHGFGHTRFEHETHGIAHTLDWFVSAEDPLRVCRLTLTNTGDRERSLSVTQFIEWVLGDSRSRAQQLVVTWMDTETETLTAHNHFNLDFPGRCTFLACDLPLSSWTASRTEFVGRNRTPSNPAAMGRKHLGGVSGRYHDNCGALQTLLFLAPGETREVTFLLGQAATLEESRTLVQRYRSAGAGAIALTETHAAWDDLLGTVQVQTPDPKLDLLLNGRLLYQVTACRLWGRTATYQSSGAYGFRDQLQDVMALLVARPELVREQIVEASRHQFPEGDVLHWWQPFSGRGVRTHITDDRHWLPLVVAEYLSATGDTALLDERTPFIEGPPLPQEAEDAYLTPPISEQTASVYEHCLRALETGRPVGANGLPLIGGADWNDGMNRVGHEGRGESVWLAWFLIHTLRRFAPVAESRGDAELATDYRAWADRLAAAVEATSWDGAWYRRGYFDDGTPLGTHTAEECRIDAIAQAWATISGAGDPKRAAIALESVEEKLVRREDGLIALLTPPFDHMAHDPGYIKGYVPGVRENGGQYTHAALWVVLAHLLRGDGDDAWGLLDLINPISHATTRDAALLYAVEPYVVAADVYAVAPHTGRGGWTWYTGSASWFYRVALESLLGFSVIAENGERQLRIDPCIPKDWPTFSLDYHFGAAHYRIRVDNPRGVNRGVARVTLDGSPAENLSVRLVDDGRTHDVIVTMLGG
jgi:cyclic beta-1,2-glucan synthetase